MATAETRPATTSIPTDAFPDPQKSPEKSHRMLLIVSGEMKDRIEDLKHRTGYDQGELFDIAISCFKMCLDAVEEGHRVGVIEDDREISIEFTGLHKNDPIAE